VESLKNLARQILSIFAPLVDLIFLPVSALSLLWLKLIRKIGNSRLALHRQLYNSVGVYPIRDHYYEPLFNFDNLNKPLDQDRYLPGINWNHSNQINFLKNFKYSSELLQIPLQKTEKLEYNFANDTFGPGDSEYLYNLIRYAKPKRIVEIGSGNSTLMATKAIQKNKSEDANYKCEHVCIEPYERPWLSQLNIKLVRELLENVDSKIFTSLEPNDILFIDSSHIIRPQGDVLKEYLEILPVIKSGVYAHVHDIFSPKDYPQTWLNLDKKLWNEQYLLEAFLSHNKDFEIIGALNYLKYKAPEELAQVCPVFGQKRSTAEPGSFWIRRL
jgi:predicted phosphatase